MGERTKVVVAQPRSMSLRATIPSGVVHQFRIEEGWELDWEMHAQDSQLVLVVTPIPPPVAPAKPATGKPRKKGR